MPHYVSSLGIDRCPLTPAHTLCMWWNSAILVTTKPQHQMNFFQHWNASGCRADSDLLRAADLGSPAVTVMSCPSLGIHQRTGLVSLSIPLCIRWLYNLWRYTVISMERGECLCLKHVGGPKPTLSVEDESVVILASNELLLKQMLNRLRRINTLAFGSRYCSIPHGCRESFCLTAFVSSFDHQLLCNSTPAASTFLQYRSAS